jgi:pyridoxamine 5'-phosphate oxidase
MTATKSQDPIARFRQWMDEAEAKEPNDPTAFTLATATADGAPSARMVLLKGVDQRGFVFYTNLVSRKAQELADNRRAAMCFHWKSLRRQVRIEGAVEPADDAEADAYFASRSRDSQIGAWASKQSQPLTERLELERRVARIAARFGIGAVPRPDFWSGYRLVPERMEFWRDRPFRLHERLCYELGADGWSTHQLYP